MDLQITSSPSLRHKQPQWRAPRIIRNTLSLSPAITSSYEALTDASKKISPKVEVSICPSITFLLHSFLQLCMVIDCDSKFF